MNIRKSATMAMIAAIVVGAKLRIDARIALCLSMTTATAIIAGGGHQTIRITAFVVTSSSATSRLVWQWLEIEFFSLYVHSGSVEK